MSSSKGYNIQKRCKDNEKNEKIQKKVIFSWLFKKNVVPLQPISLKINE